MRSANRNARLASCDQTTNPNTSCFRPTRLESSQVASHCLRRHKTSRLTFGQDDSRRQVGRSEFGGISHARGTCRAARGMWPARRAPRPHAVTTAQLETAKLAPGDRPAIRASGRVIGLATVVSRMRPARRRLYQHQLVRPNGRAIIASFGGQTVTQSALLWRYQRASDCHTLEPATCCWRARPTARVCLMGAAEPNDESPPVRPPFRRLDCRSPARPCKWAALAKDVGGGKNKARRRQSLMRPISSQWDSLAIDFFSPART